MWACLQSASLPPASPDCIPSSPPKHSVHSDLFEVFTEDPRRTLPRPFVLSFLSLLSSIIPALISKYFPPISQSSFHSSLDLSLSPITSSAQPLLLLQWKMIRIIYSESDRQPISPALSYSLFFTSREVMSTLWIMQHRLLSPVQSFELRCILDDLVTVFDIFSMKQIQVTN